MTLLAIDQGTTSTRALLAQPDGRLQLLASHAHRQVYPAPGHVEHNPEELIANLAACLAAAPQDVTAVGFANQGESCLAWDGETGRAVSPVIVWQDSRTAPETERLKAEGAEALTLARAGLPLDPYFSASKLGWILRHIPEAQDLAARGRLRLGTTDAFFRDRLTGRYETDITTASRTSLMTLDTGQWDADLCALFGVPMELLPPITPCAGAFGTVQTGAGPRPLTASLVDQQAALYGHGCRAAGDAKITFGTGAFALAVTGEALCRPASGPVPTIAWQIAGAAPTYALDGGVYAASSAVNWARDMRLFQTFDAIARFEAPSAIARGLAFVPALAGLACPHWDRAARGAWMGLSLDTSPADMMQALLEGVAFRSAEVLESMGNAVPLSAPVSIDGGMSANPYFCQFLCDALGREIRLSDEAELTALGTAAMAAAGASLSLEAAPKGRLLHPRALPDGAMARFRAAREAVQAYGHAVTG
ncbi:FGGY family carbohydrate kinase [Pseudooceanicola nanhaiensis]|uniref:FGGY family carbohydrate kinase n=1 Tax=Pseudooceanicola nanhaiensis TaxID=375761 RepID=UPI001CD65F08|nr:FGGY family carbohydrate kinase [Pseudooceanicola nanhaiensis]MCA0922242.1 glycerol kinase [Pseudooceanicola nanhaiensis]